MWQSYLDKIEEQVRKISEIKPIAPLVPAVTGSPYPDFQGNAPFDPRTGNMPDIPKLTGRQQFEQGLSGGLYGSTPVVNVSVMLDGQEITGAVSNVQTNNYLSGKIIQMERLQSTFR
jgi:hypothetical protein